jgi:hypothetical protein
MGIPNSTRPLFLAAAGQAAGGAGYEIERSVRFNSSDSAYLSRTPASAGNRRTYTYSTWVKRAALGTGTYYLFTAVDGGNADIIGFEVDRFYWYNSFSGSVNSQNLYRDPSAWYHVLASVDSTQAIGTDRVKLYVNGAEVAYAAALYPSLNRDFAVNNIVAHKVGQYFTTNSSDFYLADVHFIDGQALDPSSFTEFDDNGVLQPKAFSGSYGTNGFSLPFSDNSTAAALGTDTSGNGNDWTVNNITPNTGGLFVYSNYYTFTGSSLGAPEQSFDLSAILTFVDASGNITNAAWSGTYIAGAGSVTWTPPNPIPITSSLDVYGGAYNNIATSYTITITYEDTSTEIFNGTSSSSNWVKRCTAASPAGKSIQSISVSSSSYPQLNAVRIDGIFLSNYDTKDNDSHVDVPTNGSEIDTGVGGEVRGNYATWNSVDKYLGRAAIILSNGNLDVLPTASTYQGTISSTLPLPRFGKWYWEIQSSDGTFTNMLPGLQTTPQDNYSGYVNGFCVALYSPGAYYVQSPLVANPPLTWTAPNKITDVYGFAVDMDEGKFYLYYNGVIQNGGEALFTNILDETRPIYPAMSSHNGVQSYTNFGQSRFVYPAPTGYKTLCSTNITGTPFITSGFYIGNGIASGPVVFTGGVPLAVTVQGTPLSFGTNADKLSGGFKIRSTSAGLNTLNGGYNFVVTSTGDPVDKARAQIN